MRNFKNYRVWHKSMALARQVYSLAKCLPNEERFVLAQQIRRSAISIPSNIAEGCGRESDREFKRFIEIALSSAFELETQVLLADSLFDLGTQQIYLKVQGANSELQPALNALMQSLNVKL